MATKEDTHIQSNITLEDIYKAFGVKKKHYATRLKHAFLENRIESFNDLMQLSINDLLNMHGVGSETLRLLVKKLNNLGVDYYPQRKDGTTANKIA